MKIRIVSICVLAMSLALSSKAMVGVSAHTNGVYVAMGGAQDGPATSTPIGSDQELVWDAFSDASEVELFYPSEAYWINVRMLGPDGNEVPKTGLGKTWGSKWNSTRSLVDNSKPGFRCGRIGSISARGKYDARYPGLGKLLPAASRLFVMAKPGIYVMEVQMQMFRRAAPGSKDKYFTFFEFSPVKLKVEKKAENPR
jgi:hypothetical protein